MLLCARRSFCKRYHWHQTSTATRSLTAPRLFVWFIYVPILQNPYTPVTPLPASLSGPVTHLITEAGRHITHQCKIKTGKRVIVYKKYHNFSRVKSEAELENLLKGKNGEYNGFMSPATARKVKTMLENWLYSLEQNITNDWQLDTKLAFANTKGPEYYPTFVTLTLPAEQMHDDNYIKRNLLNRFIINLKTRYNVGHYFWRAEPQKNGNIHFHILTDRYIHWKAIRHDWNQILDEYGYIEAYRRRQQERHANGFNGSIRERRHRMDRMRDMAAAMGKPFDEASAVKRVRQQERKAYEEGLANNWSDPNSTDIHAISKLDSLTAYVVKYVCKSDGTELIENREQAEDHERPIGETKQRKLIGRIWGCSDGIRDLKHYDEAIATEIDYQAHTHDNDEFELVRHLEREARKKANDPKYVWQDEESGTIVYSLDKEAHHVLKVLFPNLFEKYAHHHRLAYARLYGKPEPIPKFLDTVDHIPIESDSFIKSDSQTGETIHANLSNFPTGLHSFSGVRLNCPF